MQTKHLFSQKYDPISTLISFQHQANHYKNIVNPRKTNSYFHTIQPQQDKKLTHLSILNSKYEKQKRQSIKRQNRRIFIDCYKIQMKKGLLQRAQQQFRSIQSQKNRKQSLKNPFKCKEQQQKRIKENLLYKQKISSLKPLVGDRKQWKKHEQKNNKLIQQLKSFSSQQKQRYKAENILKLIISNQKNRSGGILKLFKMLDSQKQKDQKIQNQNNKKVRTARTSKKRKHRTSKNQTPNNQQQQQHKQQVKQLVLQNQIEQKLIQKLQGPTQQI